MGIWISFMLINYLVKIGSDPAVWSHVLIKDLCNVSMFLAYATVWSYTEVAEHDVSVFFDLCYFKLSSCLFFKRNCLFLHFLREIM